MTAHDLIEQLRELPPETPVVSFMGADYHVVSVYEEQMYRTVSGAYSKFRSSKNQHRNDVKVVVIR